MNGPQMSLVPAPGHRSATGMLRVITFNVQHAAPGRAHRQADWIAASTADVVVLTEVGHGEQTPQAMCERGFAVHDIDGGFDYRTVIASRVGDLEPAREVATSVMPHRAPAARLHLAGSATVGLVGLYVPSRGPRHRRNVDKRAFQQAVAELLPTLHAEMKLTGPVIVAGDLNVVEPGHVPHHTVFRSWEYTFYSGFIKAGLVDAYRHLHPAAVTHSWFGRNGSGYRFDHIFTTHPETVTGCAYLQEPRVLRLSDHAAMTATFTVTP
ncbi:exodeoxyribonuclease III [Microbispora sp. NBRC 16548]|nr:exodeoxyribonuclease III [Microbispora sp. NBRC 16548]